MSGNGVFIVKISHGCDRFEWLCHKHILELRKRGEEVEIKPPGEFPRLNIAELSCDRCPPTVATPGNEP